MRKSSTILPMYYRVFAASQRYHGNESLTYKSEKNLKIGQIVAIPLLSKYILGIVEDKTVKPKFTAKNILDSWDLYVPKKSFVLLKWLRNYYPAPLGILTGLFTPPNLPKKLSPILNEIYNSDPIQLPPLTLEQQDALKSIESSKSNSVLLHGDTGTGKTRVYIELSKKALVQGKSVIILTPEIGLTGVLLDTFSEAFGDKVLVTHSDMTPKERRSAWVQASRSNSGLIVIGPRSAIFTPLKNIGLVVMDEAHDGAYKQEKSPHYQSSRVAAKLADIHGARFVMGTATPLVSDYFAFQNKNLHIQRMTKLAISSPSSSSILDLRKAPPSPGQIISAGSGLSSLDVPKGTYPSDKPLPTRADLTLERAILRKSSVKIIDLRDKENFTRSPWIANPLLDAISTAIKQNEQILLFLNRRGSARLVLCDTCGWHAVCPRCDVSLTFHHDTYNMRCHSCGFNNKVPTNCPTCSSPELKFRSIGTKTLEVEVSKLFPGATVSRFDGDTTKLQSLNQQRKALQNGKIDILIGTQSIVKGFDLPKLSVVGVIQADSSLQIPDYTASELTYQLISQVSGRINRGHRQGSLFVQTYDPGSSLIEQSLKKDYGNFYKHELYQRKLYNFPPYTYLLKISCARSSSKSAYTACSNLANKLRSQLSNITIEGPSPRFIEKVAGRYTWHLVIKTKNRNNLLEVIQNLPGNCTYDLDPSDLL